MQAAIQLITSLYNESIEWKWIQSFLINSMKFIPIYIIKKNGFIYNLSKLYLIIVGY